MGKFTRANYQIVNRTFESVTIRDMNGPVSVTNDIEAVVEQLMKHHGLTTRHRLFYYDSEGQLDEVVFNKNGFVDFKCL